MSIKNSDIFLPQSKAGPVVKPGEFAFAAARLDHGHIYAMTEGLTQAGGQIKWVYEPDPEKLAAFQSKFPGAKAVRSLEEIFDDPEVRLVAAAAVACERGPLGCTVMEAGKDYFTDKTPFTTLDQFARARETAARTGRKYMVYYGERIHVECAMHAGTLIDQGVIGRVIEVIGLGPHRLNAPSRPAWFFNRELYGGILCDIGSHQIEQFLHFSGAKDARVVHALAGNYAHPDYPELEDFGEATLLADNGANNHFRVDWFTPDGLGNWGDGRTFILGTKGYIELRKYINVAADPEGEQLYLVNGDGEYHMSLRGKVGFPFFGQLILDCLNRTEMAMTQEHAFKAAELCLKAQQAADHSK